jgi:hypothetical protein
MHPLALAIAMSGCTQDEQVLMYATMESYLVRRAVCGLTAKNYNKIFTQQLKRFANEGLKPATLQAALAALEGDASRWPRDDEFRKSWVDAETYPGRLDPTRTRSLLARIEMGMRSVRTEEPTLAVDALDIDHILPTSWFEHWPLPDGTRANDTEAYAALLASRSDQPLSERHSAIRHRETAKVRLGNLTLLHYGINRGLQNCAFERKRESLFAESNLQLNRQLMRLQEWNEEAIDQRGRAMFDVARQIWQGPA